MRVLYLEDNALDADLVRLELKKRAPDIQLDIVSSLAEALHRVERFHDLYGTSLGIPAIARPEIPVVPEWAIAGIAAVETGSTYRDGMLVHYRDRRDGADGEVGPWQLTPAALSDLGVLHLRPRIRTEPVLAESMMRAGLLRCYQRTGDWHTAVAIYHTGPRGDRRRGRSYADRVLAAGSVQVAQR